MTNTKKRIAGCYKRVLTFLLIVVAVSTLLGIVAYRQVGGTEGARHWMAERAVNSVEKRLLTKNRPDGITETQITSVFTNVREALQKRQINLPALYEVLKAYQTEFRTKKPATPEIQTFLEKLEGTILESTGGKD